MTNCINARAIENQKKCPLQLQAEPLVNKPHYYDIRPFDDLTAAIEICKVLALLAKRFNVDFTVIDLSIQHLCLFHYDGIKEKYYYFNLSEFPTWVRSTARLSKS